MNISLIYTSEITSDTLCYGIYYKKAYISLHVSVLTTNSNKVWPLLFYASNNIESWVEIFPVSGNVNYSKDYLKSPIRKLLQPTLKNTPWEY